MKKNILITGVTSGIGKTVAEHMKFMGHKVIGTSRNPNAFLEGIDIVPLDVTKSESVSNAFSAVLDRLPKLDVLINNAGFGVCGPLEETPIEDAKSQLETNYFGLVQMTNKWLPHFRENNQGLIINISSMAGLMGLPFQGHYSASKYAVEGYTESLRMELKPFNINVCSICPGDFSTSFTANRKYVPNISDTYKKRHDRFMKRYSYDELHGANPILVATLIEKLITKKQIRGRYLVGKKSQTIAYSLKRFLGSHIFESILTKTWPT